MKAITVLSWTGVEVNAKIAGTVAQKADLRILPAELTPPHSCSIIAFHPDDQEVMQPAPNRFEKAQEATEICRTEMLKLPC